MLKWNTPEGLLDLTIKLVEQTSVSGTKNEINMANLTYEILSELPYFKENPDHLALAPLEGDLLGRKFVAAIVKSKKKTNKTLLTVGHFDTVDIQDYNSLKHMCCSPYKLTKAFKEEILPDDAKKDLDSGDWLFGRGIMDMKAGVAWQMSLLEKYSQSDELTGNLLFMVVPDEESNSAGVLSAIPFVNKWIDKYELEPFAVLNTEPNFASYPGDDNKYIYLGTAGKLLPGFYFIGQECHVGESLSGLNANLIAAEFIRRLEINTELSDFMGKEVAVPPTCLKYKDLKELYSAQTPNSAVAYFNIQTLKMSPGMILGKFKEIAHEALTDSINRVETQSEIFKNLSKLPVNREKMEPKVLGFDELYSAAKNQVGEGFEKVLESKIEHLVNDVNIDERELNTKIITEVYNLSNLRGPMVVLHFSPPYYPHVGSSGKSEIEKKIKILSESIIKQAADEHGEEIHTKMYHQGLTDLSYFALQDAEEVIDYLIPNTPSWGKRYKFPVEEIRKLNLPVLNFGPHGRDPHKYTERIEVNYSFDKGPKLLGNLVEGLFKI